MAVVLKERGFKVEKLKAQCKGFKCKEGVTNCCCWHILFNKPDFADVSTLLEALCAKWGPTFQVLILPKFHCELNFIEQCWGYAKRLYHMYPPTKKDDEMEANVLKALNAVPIECMWRSRRFLNAYRQGLNGKQAAWANKKYHGRYVLPDSILNDLDDNQVV
ncbi:hypothetical protein PAXRUDRAFT_143877 [Paxillus rubicundulus Ve08.2h10]|uniref:Uncharacterized protein n=1 Tax=Paxillus rubicundulus Ve08.2h10 TaxID=930991 RepID=A0A0D0E1A0_9AGAM|nr:hypothetical protein PAXRUDRAFT_143877 [Paxillus rubicundulus Ve08.2h10]